MAVNVRKVEIEVAPGKSLKCGYWNSARKEIATGLDVTTDPSSAWTTEQTVRISFGASPCLDVHLEINAYTDAHNLRSRQRAFLYMNGSFVGFVTFDGTRDFASRCRETICAPKRTNFRSPCQMRHRPSNLASGRTSECSASHWWRFRFPNCRRGSSFSARRVVWATPQ